MTSLDQHHHACPDGSRQPNSQMCFVCGVANIAGLKIRFHNMGDHVEAEVVFTDNYQGFPGITHGGIVSTVLDETMGRVGLLKPDSTRLFLTAKMEIKYRHSVPLNTPIRLRGYLTKDRGRVILARAEAVLPDGTVAVESTGTMMEFPAEEFEKLDTPEIGWRIYEDHEFPE